MTTEITPAGTPPAGTVTPAPVTPPAPVPVTPPTDDKAPAQDPSWLKSRLERERTKGAKEALASAGFADEAAAKQAAADAKAAAESKKSAEQKAIEASKAAESEKARADSLLAIATEHAARMMVGLTAEQQGAVKAIAGEDPARQLATIGALAPTWAKSTAPPTTEKPATTAPPATAPSGVTPAPTDARAVYESTRAQNPFAAATFGVANPQVYTPKQ